MKIYTRSGDEGETGLLGGSRIRKSSLRVNCYGNSDELNSVLGWCAASDSPLAEQIKREQSHLFTLGSYLASPPDSDTKHLPKFEESWILVLEEEIDSFEKDLPELKNFILPGGSEAAARVHVARTICRRAERALDELAVKEKLPEIFLRYLNRLSDWLFVVARYLNFKASISDEKWRTDV